MGNASPLEIALTTLAVIGLLGAIAIAIVAVLDYAAVHGAIHNGTRRRIAFRMLHEGLRKVITFAMFIAIGMVLMGTPPPLREANIRAMNVVVILLTILNGYLVLDTYWTLQDEYWVRLRLLAEDRTKLGKSG